MDVNKLQTVADTAAPGFLTYTVFKELMDQLVQDLQKELIDQGHVLTGKLAKGMEIEVSNLVNSIMGTIHFEDYGVAVDSGVKAPRIPYTRGSKAGTSAYIAGLIDFWEHKGLSDGSAKSAAFATAMKHKSEGMPTKDSYLVSANERRTGFIDQAINGPDINSTLTMVFDRAIQKMMNG